MLTPVRKFVETARTREGASYVFGAEASAENPNPRKLDCSELVEWAAARCGVTPRVPDGAFNQWVHTKHGGKVLTVAEGIATYGALLFAGDGTGSGRDAITHVAISLGNGMTTEARGSSWGVGSWSAKGRFDFAGLLPGIDYSNKEEDIDMAAADDILRVLGAHELALTEVVGNVRKLLGKDFVDEAKLADELAPLISMGVTSVSDEDLERISKAVNDESARRQAA